MSEQQIVKKDEMGELFVFAKDPAQMTVAQQHMIEWAERKIEAKKKEYVEFKENLDIATKNKWRTSTLKAAVARAERKVIFYEKVRDALKAGYYIIPDMNIDVFAVRTTAKKPRAGMKTGRVGQGMWMESQKSNTPPAGEGKYVDPNRGTFEESRFEQQNKDGTKTEMVTKWWDDFAEIDFPFAMAKPDVLVATADALSKKIFDEVGILPRRPGGDPMVVGRIVFRAGTYQRKNLNFLVAWFLDTKDI